MCGMKEEPFEGLVRSLPYTVAEFRVEATTLEKALQQHARHYNRDTSGAPINLHSAGLGCNTEALRELVGYVVHEGLWKLLQPQVILTVSYPAVLIWAEVRHAMLQPQPGVQPISLEQPR